ncbi:MAG: ParA family protein [Chitinophagales bacterium]|nr:ParA family protein [Chitinophagales bacterium]
MSKVISLSNHKGGVGKTTSTVNISVGLSRMLHKRVLVIDMDPQANLTQSLGVEGNPQHNIYGALTGSYALHPIIIEENLHIIPATLDLSGAEVELSAETGREFILRELIDPLRNQYDYILIDTPPSLGLLTVNALTASDHIYIPLQAQYLALQGLTKLLEVVERIRKRLNRHLSLGGVFITQYDQRKVLNREIAQTIREHFKDKVFQTVIRDNIALAEAPSTGKDIFAYNNRSYGAEDYLELCKEIIAKK